MKKIALTGGIASGKSHAGNFFSNKNIFVIDLDDINHDVLSNNTQELQLIFGKSIVVNDKINKAKIKQIVFNNKDKLQQLENLVHPQIIQQLKVTLSNINQSLVIVIVPLLYEKKMFYHFDKAIIITTLKQLQIQRIINRDNISYQMANAIIDAQATNEERLSIKKFLTTIVIENNKTIEEFNHKLSKIKL